MCVCLCVCAQFKQLVKDTRERMAAGGGAGADSEGATNLANESVNAPNIE